MVKRGTLVLLINATNRVFDELGSDSPVNSKMLGILKELTPDNHYVGFGDNYEGYGHVSFTVGNRSIDGVDYAMHVYKEDN